MKNNIKLLDVDKLKCHEEVVEKHVESLMKQIINDGMLKRPIIVEKNSLVILDGTHRYHIFQKMGLKKIPVQLVDYSDGEVRVYLRRKEFLMKMIKEFVVKKASEGKLFPSKTTRHLIKKRIGIINFPLSGLY